MVTNDIFFIIDQHTCQQLTGRGITSVQPGGALMANGASSEMEFVAQKEKILRKATPSALVAPWCLHKSKTEVDLMRTSHFKGSWQTSTCGLRFCRLTLSPNKLNLLFSQREICTVGMISFILWKESQELLFHPRVSQCNEMCFKSDVCHQTCVKSNLRTFARKCFTQDFVQTFLTAK